MSISPVSSAYSYYSYTAASKAATAANTEKASNLKQINSKLQMGTKLTAKELSYLEAQDSGAYKEATKINDERSAYRKQLDSAKTKLDVEKLRSTKMQELSDELKSVKNNSKLTEDEKTSRLSSIQKRQMAIVSETQDYTSSSRYNNLSLTTKANFQSMLEDGEVGCLLSYFDSSKLDATSFLSIFNSARSTLSQTNGGYYSAQLNAAQKLVDASFHAQSISRQSIITQVLARESAKLTDATAVSQATETAAKLNLTV